MIPENEEIKAINELTENTVVARSIDYSVCLFFMGTKQHHERDQSLITQFYKYCVSDSGLTVDEIHQQHSADPTRTFQFTAIFDGPGCSVPKDSENSMPGTYIYVPDKNKLNMGRKVAGSYSQAAKTSKFAAQLTGAGVEDNVYEVIARIQDLEEKLGAPPKTVNLWGFSRGSHTAKVTENILHMLYPDIEFNFPFLGDDVPGPTRKSNPLGGSYTSATKRVYAPYSLHEDGSAFEAADETRLQVNMPTSTFINNEPLPGAHGAATKAHSKETSHLVRLATIEAYEIAKQAGVQFINNSGAPQYIMKTKSSTGKDLVTKEDVKLDDYADAGKLALFYGAKREERKYRDKTYKSPITRDILKNHEDYVRDSQFFYCQRHRELFHKVLPHLFAYRFNQANGETNRAKLDEMHEKAYEEFKKLKADDPYLFELMVEDFERMGICRINIDNKNGTDNYQFILDKIPQGTYEQEEYRILEHKPLIDENSELSRLTYAVKSITNYAVIKNFARLREQTAVNVANRLKSRLKEITTSNKSEAAKINELRKEITDACKELRQKHAVGRLLYQLEAVIDNAESYGLRILDTIGKHLEPLKNESIRELPKTDFGKSLLKLQNDIGEIIISNHSEEYKKAQITEKTEQFLLNWRLNSTEERKALANDLKIILEERKTQFDIADHVLKHVNSYILRSQIKEFFTSIYALFSLVKQCELIDRQERRKVMEELRENIMQAKLEKNDPLKPKTDKAYAEQIDALLQITAKNLGKNIKSAKDPSRTSLESHDVAATIVRCRKELAPIIMHTAVKKGSLVSALEKAAHATAVSPAAAGPADDIANAPVKAEWSPTAEVAEEHEQPNEVQENKGPSIHL